MSAQLSQDARTLTVRVPLTTRRRGGRKLVVAIAPAGIAERPKAKVDNTIVKALGRAHRWKRLLESGEYSSIGDLAASEKINHSYVRRLLRLTLLSPQRCDTVTKPLKLSWLIKSG